MSLTSPPLSAAVVRDTRTGDLPAVQAIYAEAVRTGTASFELDPPDLAEMIRRWHTVRQGGYPHLVAETADGRIAGYAYASPFRPRAAYRYTVEDSIYINPAFQGQGLGRRLLGAVIDRCTAAGYRQMIAVIGDSANAGSIALHASHGFTPSGTLTATGTKFGRWIDTVLMQRVLAEGPPPQDRPE